MNYLKSFSEQRGNRVVSSASRDVKSSVKKDAVSFKSRRSVSADSRSRGSYIPDRLRPSSEERKSGNSGYMRWSGARKSSISDAKRCTKDMRPLADKNYQKKKINEIIEFLEASDFKYPITAAKLMPPSKRDFEVIFQFLYNFFDPLYEVKKLEDEAPKLLKNLGYPFNVNKSAFIHIARTNWSSLLGILIWFVDLAKFAAKVNLKNLFEADCENDKAQIHLPLRRYILRRYYDENESEEEDEAVFHEMMKLCVTEDVDVLVAKNEEKKLLLESVEKEIAEINNLTAKKADLEVKLKKYDDYLQKMQSHYDKKNAVCEKLANELKVKESEANELLEEISKKQEAYDAQGFDGKKQLLFFESQKKELLEKLESKRSTQKTVQDKVWELEIQFNRNLEKVNAAAESFNELYNSVVQDAKNILQPLENINSVQLQKTSANFHLDFPDFVMQPNKCYAEWNDIYKDTLQGIERTITRTNEILEGTVLSQNQQLMELQVQQTEISTQLKTLAFKKNQIKHDGDLHDKENMEQKEMLNAQCEKINQSLETLRGEKLRLTDLRKEMIEELEVLKALKEKKSKQLKEYLDKKKSMFEYCAKMEKKVADLSEDLGNEVIEKLEEIERCLREI